MMYEQFVPATFTPRKVISTLVIVLFLWVTPSFATDGARGDELHDFHQNEIGAFLGVTTPFDKDMAGGTSFTIGFDYERRFTAIFGAIGFVEFVRGDHKRTELFAALFAWRPLQDLRVGVGPGFEFVEKDESTGGTKRSTHFLIVTRANYEFHLDKVTLSPTVGLDFIGETKINVLYGLTVGYGF